MYCRRFWKLFLTLVTVLLSSVGLWAQKYLPGADFSALTADNHPRLFYTADEFAALKKEVKAGNNANVVRLHKLTIEAADMAVNDPKGFADLAEIAKSKIA
jgi:hypothetical protein